MSAQSHQDADQFRLAGEYCLPYDKEEASRLDLQHELFRLTFQGRLYFAPIQQPNTILDIGCGTSSWPIEMARKFPECSVQGLDLALPDAFTSEPPSNYKFVQANFEQPWPIESNTLDYIHQRFLMVAIKDHQFLIREAFRNLKPGGWYEIVELESPFRRRSGLVGEWSQVLADATKALGRNMEAAPHWDQWMKDTGFVNVHREQFSWPVGCPPGAEGHMAEVGELAGKNIKAGVTGFSMTNLTDGLGWTKEQVLEYTGRVRQDIDENPGTNFLPIHVVWGQKPE